MFIDTSVFVAIFAHEEDAKQWLALITSASGKMTSALVILESAMRLTSKLKLDPAVILDRMEAFLADASIAVVPIGPDHGTVAVQALAKFGKGRGHPAQLNLADCLSYACAKSRGIPLLYKGGDFFQTDLA